jgi:ubiquinone biosynthesis protein COQ9
MTALPHNEMTLDELRLPLVEAMLPHVPFDGWSRAAAERACEDLGVPPERSRIVFPGGAGDMVAAYTELADRRMLEGLAGVDLGALKIRNRIRLLVRTRLEQAAPHREAVRRTLAVLAMPQNLGLSTRLLWRSADTMWRAAGDTATDFNHYTKRLLLGGVYSSTLLVWLDDKSEGFAETWAFLDRRIENVMRIEKAKARFAGGGERRPSLTRFLGRLRYPGV